MIKQFTYLLILTLLVSCGSSESDKQGNKIPETSEIEWRSFTPEVFDEAKAQNKLVLLEVGANWCHWCHVMDDSTYSNPEVQAYLHENFILVREDQDSRPDLYAAYKTWGWPAIIVMNEEGQDVKRLKGYQKRGKFLKILKEVRANPIAIPDDLVSSGDSKPYSANSSSLYNAFLKRVDHEKGAYHWSNKYLHLPGFMHGLKNYRKNDSLKNWTDKTLKGSYNLVDPAWSGVYQYSAKKSWTNQHYEKLLRVQANYIQAYALYGAIAGDKTAIQTAEEIVAYCERFFGNASSLYYNSQNADLVSGVHSEEYYQLDEKERLKEGTPSVDESIYLKENCQMAKSLFYLWASSNKEIYFTKAIQITNEILADYSNADGVYTREKGKNEILSFSDNRHLLDLLMMAYHATGKKEYMRKAKKLGFAIQTTFLEDYGFASAKGNLAKAAAKVELDNLLSVLTFNQLSQVTGDKVFHDLAEQVYETTDKAYLFTKVGYVPLLQLADEQLNEEAYHAVFLTDGNNDKLGREFYKKILLHPSQYFVFEYLPMDEMNEEQQMMYGGLPAGTLFMCTSSYCSAPIYEVKDLEQFLKTI